MNPLRSRKQAAQQMQQQITYSGRDQSAAIFFLVLAAYFVLQIVIRVSMPDSLEIDEAEQAFVFQQLRPGYGSQPPLYAWLQWLMFSIFGVNLFALAALKNLLLFGTYFGMFRLARPLIGVTGAIAASASLILLPSISWESHVDRTHSVLLTFLACATLWCYFALLRHPTTERYALFGLLVGLGLQSKYNFAVFIAGLASASLLSPRHRQTLWNRKAWLSVAIALLCLLPHGLWLANHSDAASSSTLYKLSKDDDDAGYLRDVARGMGNTLVAALAFITPLWLVYAFICRRDFRNAGGDRKNPDARFFARLYLAFLAWMMLLLLSGEVSTIQSRWMQPLLFSLPLAFFLLMPGLAQAVIFKRILTVCVVVAMIIPLALALRFHIGPALGKHGHLHHPYPELSCVLARRFPQAHTVIANDMLVAGNLYFQRPSVRTLLLDDTLTGAEPVQGDVLLVLRAGTQAGWLQRFFAGYPFSTLRQRGRLGLRYGYLNGETMWFEYALVTARSRMPGDDGDGNGKNKPADDGRGRGRKLCGTA
jgi:4-amino-4-deoxy-L-arabinose transferase-like glycosyltransferase